MLAPLLDHLAESEDGLALARDGGDAFCSSALRPFLIAALLAHTDARPAIVVAPDDRAAGELAADLTSWLAPRRVRFYPSRGVTYESHLAPPPHLVGLRIAALDALAAGEPAARAATRPGGPSRADGQAGGAPVVVASAPALSEKVPDPALRPHSFELVVGELLDLDECAQTLVEMGYERVSQVEDRGQFAVRGGLLDLFAATAERAVRVELFDIEIESLRTFSTFTQRSLEAIERIEVAPAAELALEHRGIALEGERADIAELLPVARFHPLLELVGEEAELIVTASEEIGPTLRDHWADVCAAFHDAEAHHLYVAPSEIEAALSARARIRLHALAGSAPLEFHAQAVSGTARSLGEAESGLERDLRSGYRTVVTWTRRGDGERAAHNLARLSASWLEDRPPQDRLTFAQATLREGFVAPGLRLAVIPDHLLFHRRRPLARPAIGRRGALRSFADLRTGDIVVHEDHGIARFAGFETRTVAGVTRDYLYLEYQGDDRVFAPTDQFAKISRYVGAGGEHPPLSRLGGTRWDTLKARARHAAQELAGELLSLYVERKRREGHAFAADGDWQREFEQRFPYTETPDQREAIELVKADMEEPRPMDRLICGDVGYGKTEVALRAAFKAAADGKQVLLLAPTTILAQQHFGTFRERLADYPFTVDHVSRFRTPAAQREALERFRDGRLDILIGTHRLLSRDVRAKDLGLLIIDEEQRFGVKQKERLRQLRLRVDVIAMSATPIPRSLQMSLAGLRDISVIETAPEGRRPVRTYVGEFDETLVRQALERERARGGQAFYLHNRVETIDEVAERLRGLCPDIRFAVAHGQLEEGELESRMMMFLRGDADVLVCTSIIESGIDIPAANTLIVERSDHFGLAQLYQIRGRVGRSRERAYAYMLYDAAGSLSAEGAQRLAALSDFTELGSGFKIAMRDLELRGAGNLLGDEQSGHVAALGFELYMQMLDEALAAAEASGEGADSDWEPVRVDVDVDAYVPAEYVGYEQAKIDLHRRIATARDVADIEALREELADRFGPPPEPVEHLLALARARIKLGAAGARAVSVRAGRLTIAPIELDSAGLRELRARLPGAVYESGRSQVSVRVAEAAKERFAEILAAADAVLAATGSRQ
jgi:transcription-repair coupling factor (superfamily II helicase)